ncbi:epiplakin-like isoform X5 [Sebastes umbrosus]|uniref:epiplakin-like isoform X5 n=1 Tax=Sebastes umbrosus TaxID=72105 RepID=UPI00189ECEB3|nr:epiplakin-like isoform X5 [Sebastes umbrosus]
MSMYGSQKALNMGRRNGSKGDLSGMQQYARSEVVHMGGGNGYEPYLDGYNTYNFSKSSGGGMGEMSSSMMRQMSSGMGGGMMRQMSSGGMMREMSSGMGGGGTMTRMSSGGGGGGMGEMSSSMMREVSSGMGGGMMTSVDGGMMSGMGGGMSGSSTIHQRAMILQAQCQEYLKKAEYALQSGGASGDAERYMSMAKETIEQLKGYAMDLRQMGQPNDNVVRTLEICKDQLKGVHMVMTGSLNRRRSTRGSSGGWEEPPRSFQDAMGWIAQQKRLIETASWGDDPAAIEQQLINHSNFHSSIQRSVEVERARDELMKKGDKGNLHALDQEWDSLQQMSFGRTEQLQNLKRIIQDMSKEIMWVNDREEEELMFDWGDKNIDQYIPRKQESYSKLMSALEEKEKDLNKLKARVDGLLKLNHPASDKIEAYRDTLQTQWSWLLQITKCIDVHLKENAAYNQFFKEANETYSGLQKEHETVRMKFACDKNTSLEDLMELLQGLEREKENIMENKRQVHHLVNKSRTIVRLKPRNPEEKSSTPVIVKALCDYKQDQKVICKENEAILKDNSQRSKWDVTGPGGLDMLVPSVCLIVPPPNPLGISMANKNEQYYEAILSIWSQLYINVKSLIAWQYCLIDIRKINSLTVTMLSRMRPEEYRQLIKSLESRYEEFKMTSHGSQMFADEDKKMIENQVTGAQTHYDQIVVELPTYIAQQEHIEVQQASGQQYQQQLILVQQASNQQHQQQLILLQQQQQQQAAAEAEARRLEEEARWREEEARRLEEETRRREAEARRLEEETRRREAETRRLEEERRRAELKRAKKTEVKLVKKVKVVTSSAAPPVSSHSFSSSSTSTSSSSSSRSLTELHALRLRLEASEGTLSQHVHICLGDDWMHDCGLKISELEMLLRNVDSMREEHLRLREHILKELEGMNDSDKAQFLRNEVEVINQRLGSLESSSSAYLDRLKALRDMLESVEQAEDIVKVHEARLVEKETTSLSPNEVEEYMLTLKNVKAELDLKRGILATMETELAKANHWSGQLGGPFQRCDMMLSKYSEQVVLLSDRWRRLLGQIDTRVQDLQSYQPQLEHYKQTSTSLIDWIDATRTKQDTLQATKIESIQTLMDQINNQKALNSEIKSRRETVESVLRDNEACVISIKDYETDLASYTSGLETLLNIPIKRTMLKSPSMDLNLEATQLQTRYMELLTHSGDYYKFLGELLKNMEELKIRNTRIDLLEEELRLLREGMRDRDSKNKSLEESVSRYELELSDSRDKLLSIEEVKQTATLQCSATMDSLDSTQSQLADLNDEVTRLNYLLEEEKRKRRLAEERYTTQQEEYELVLRKRQKELDTVSWSKVEIEKSVTNKDHEIEQLRRQLAEEAARIRELQKEMSKTTTMMQSIQSQYNEIVNERDALLLRLQLSDKDKDRYQRLEDELSRIKLSQDSELRSKQRIQDENERAKRDSDYWKDQFDSKQVLIRQYETDKERLEREKNSLKSELERLMRDLRELDETYKIRLSDMQKELREVAVVRKTMETELMRVREPPTLDPSTLVFDGVRKPVTANQLVDCGVLDKPTLSQLVKGHKTVPDVSVDKKVSLKGTGPIAGVVIQGPKGPGSFTGPLCKMTFTEAKKENLLPPDSVDLLLDAQAATGHIIDPRTNRKLTVEEACDQGVVDEEDRERLLAAEAAAVGYCGPGTNKPLSVFQAMTKGLIDKNTTLRLLQAQESVGGILDPILSVFLPKDTAIERNLINDDIYHALSRRPELYLDPESEDGVTYMSMKRKCKVEPHTGLLLLPIPEKVDPSKIVFDGVRKPVTAKQLLDCGVLDKPTFKDLEKGKKNVPEVSVDKHVNLKGTGPIAGVVVGREGKMSFSEAKKRMLLPPDSADLLLEAQAATGHIIDPRNNQKLTVDEACDRGVVDIKDRDRLLEAEAAAVGYKDFSAAKPLSVFEAMKKELIDRKTGLRLLQAQESVGGILDPNLSVFLPKNTAIKRNLLDENLRQALNQSPECYCDPETERDASYGALKKRCKTEPHTGLLLLPITEKLDPSKLIFDGVRKPVTAQQLLDCGVLDKPTFNQLMKGEKTVPQVSVDKKVFLKGTGSISGVAAGPLGKMSFSEAKKQMLMPAESADLLLDAQAATGHIIDPTTNQKLTVEEACARRVVENRDRDRLLAAEAAAVGYRDPSTAKPLSVFEAMKKGLIDRKTGLRLLQAQESAGGILDPNLSVFLPKDTAIKRNLLDEDLRQALNQSPGCYIDPDTERDTSYGALKKRSKTESHTGLILLPINERKDPSKLIFDGVRKPVTAQQLFECGVLDKPTFDQLVKGEKTVPAVSTEKTVYLKGTGPIAGVVVGREGKMSFSEAKKRMLLPPDSADLLLEAQAATGHILDPEANQKLTVEDACAKGVVDIRDRDRLLAAEAAAVGFKDPSGAKPLSVFEAMKKGLIERKTGLRLLQAQESVGGILDPNLSVFLPKDTAVKRNLLDEELCHALNQSPECYVDPDTERDTSYVTLKRRSKTESHTGLILLPIPEKVDPSKLVFDGVRKPVTAKQLLDCGVLDKPTFKDLEKGKKNVPEVSVDKNVNLKGTGPIAGVVAGSQGKMSLSEAKKKALLPEDIADLLLEAQAATGHIIDPKNNQKLTVDEACARGVVDIKDRDRLLEAEAAAVGYKDFSAAKPLSVFEAMKKELIDRKTGLRLLQAQESVGGILDPNLSVFLPKDTAIKRNLLDENLRQALNQSPECYRDPETERDASYGALKKRCKTEPHTGLLLLPITEKLDPSKLIFDGVRKPVTAQQLLDCGVLDKPTFNQLMKGEKTVPQVSVDKKVFLKGTGSISGVAAGPLGKMSLSEAKKQMLMPAESADLLLDAQAATGHIIDPTTNQKLTVEEACAKRVVENRDRDRLLAAEAAAVGYRDPSTAKPLSVFEAMKKGLIDRKTGLRLLQAQESAGGILDPNLSVFLPKDTAIKRNLLDEDLRQALNQSPGCYIDPDTERDTSYGALKKRSKTESHTGLILLPINERKDPSKLIFDGVRKPVTAQQLFECGVLDKPTFDQLVKGEKTVPAVSTEKTVYLKGTGPIAGVVVGREGKMSFSEAKKRMLLPPDSVDLLLEAQAATGHIVDPEANQKLTVEDACARGVVDIRDRDRLLAAEAAAVGFKDPSGAKPLSVFEAMKKGLIDRKTGLRLLQAQESMGGILDPNLSVFLPKDTAVKRNLLDEELCHALNQSPECYIDPDTERDTSYGTLKRRSKTESHTGLILLPITEKKDPSKLMFDGIRKPVSAQQLFECGVLDKPTFEDLEKGKKNVPEVSVDKNVNLKGTGPIAGVVAGSQGKMSLSEAKKKALLPEDIADLLLEAQAATGHIIDPRNNQKLTVDEACARGVVDIKDRDRLLEAEAAAVGYKDPSGAKPLSVFEAMKKELIDRKTGLRLLQAQESVGGILDPNLSVFLPKDTAIKRNLLDENLRQALNQSPECYRDPETERDASYGALKKRCKTEPHTGLLLLPITEKLDPSKLIFDGVRKPVTAQQLLDCGVLDKPTFNQLMKGEKTVPQVSVDKKVFLKGTGLISGVAAGPLGKMSLSEAKKQMLMPAESADLLLDAQAATGHIIDPTTNQKLTVEEACARRVVENRDRDRLLAAEAAAVGYRDPSTAKPLSVFEAMKKGLIDRKTGLRLLQAQESAGGILDPNLSVFLPKDTAIKRNLLDEDLRQALNQSPGCYIDPDTERDTSYGALKKRSKTESHTGLILLPITEKEDPSNLMFDGIRKPVSAQQLFECGVLDKPTFKDLEKGKKNVPEVSVDKNVNLKGTGPIAGIVAGSQGKMSLSEAKKKALLPEDIADLLLEAQAATGHIIDPRNNQKLTVDEACARGVVDIKDRDRLLEAEAAAVGYKDPSGAKPLSVFEAMKKELIDRKTGLRLLQAQESVGGILDPNLSVFLPKDTAIKRNLLDENLRQALNQSPECYRDPETERDASYGALKKRCKTEPHTGLLLLPITEKLDPSKLIFDGVRKPVTAQQLLDCGVLDKPTFNQLMKGEKTVPQVSVDKKVFLKGTGLISGVAAGPLGKMSLSEAKKQMLMPAESADLLLDAQAATGHIIDPTTNQKLTVEEACARRMVENRDRDRLLAAEAAAVGYRDPSTAKPLSVFEAMKKGLIDRKTGLRLLQAQESAGGILDPNLSVFLPKDTAIKRNLLDEDLRQALNQSPGCYIDPDTERDTSYGALKKRSKTESHTGLILLPINERKDPSKLIFDGVRKPVTAQQLFECGVLDKPTFDQLMKGEKTVPQVSVDKKVFLKGTGSISGVAAGPLGKMSLSEAKKQMLMPAESADLLLDAQAATGHIIDPTTNQKLTIEEACARGVVDIRDRDRLLAAEAAAVGFKDPSGAKPLSVFEAMKKGLIDRKTGLRLLQAQESVGGILDPNLSVFLPKDTAVKRNLLDEELCHALNQSPECYIDPDTERDTSYVTLKKRGKTESQTGLILLPITEKKDPSRLMFDGIRKPVSALQLFECGVLDKPTLNQLVKGEKTVPAVSMEKMVYLQGTGPIAGVVAGREGKMSFSEAKKQMLLPSNSAYLLLEAQAATGYIIDPKTNQKLTVEEACARGVVDIRDRDRLLVAEAAAVGFKDPRGAKPLSVFEAMKKGLIDRKTVLRLLQAQESVGGIVDPNLSVFLPKDTAIKRNLLDEDLRQALNQGPECYVDPETENDASYGALQERCKTEPQASLKLLPVSEKKDPSKLLFDGVRKTVTAQQLLDCGVLDKPTFNKLMKGEKTVPDVSVDKKVFLKGTGSIAGVAAGPLGKMSFTEAKKQKIMSSDSADMLLEAQAATGNIIDPRTNERLTVKAACAKGVVDKEDESKLFAAEAAAIGYRDPNTGKLLSAGQAMKKGLIDKDTALRILQAQESVGGILDPALSVFLPKDIAKDRDLIDEDLYRGLNQYPECYLDPDTQQATTYVSLKKKCKADPKTGLLLLPEPKKPITVQGLRGQVPVRDLVDANLLDRSDMDQLREGRLTSQDIEDRLHSYLRGSTCIAGVYDEASDKVMPIYQAMKDGLLQSGTTLELLEAQAASGFIVDPVNNHYLTVSDAYNKRLFGPEFKDHLLSAERAVTGYKLPGTDKIISLFQAIERGLVEKGHGIRLLEAQIASGGIIDPEHSHRIDVNVAYKRGYFDEEMNKALTDQNVDTKGFFDPNTEETLAYLELKNRCITDKKTGLILLPITDKKSQESTSKNTLRKRRVVIVDPETNKEMTVRVAYDKGYIDYDTFVELSEQECEWEEITITAPDGSIRFVIIDRKTGRQYDISELLEMRVINQSDVDNYRSRTITLTQFADIISNKTKYGSSSLSSSSSASRSSAAGGTSSVTSSSTSRTSASPGTSSVISSSTSRTSASPGTSSVTSSSTLRTSAASVPSSVTSSLSSSVLSRPLSSSLSKMTTTRTSTVTERSTSTCSVPRDSTDSRRNISSISVTLSSPIEVIDEQEPVGAVFDTDCIEKISITEALDRGLVDSITAQRLLEAQACTGGIINPTNGHRLSIHEATRLGIISDNMGPKLKPAQKAFFGFEDVKNKKKLSVPQAMKERWLPYEAGQRFLEFQYVTGGIYDPEMCCRRTIDEAVEMKWLDSRDAERLQNVRDHTKNLTCPKSKLRISYKQALDNCLVEESNGLKMLQASSVSSRGISSPYNVSSAPGSTTGSRSGSRRSSRRSSVDLGSPSSSGTYHHSVSSFTTYSASSK